jgi:hypothetical protein
MMSATVVLHLKGSERCALDHTLKGGTQREEIVVVLTVSEL